MRGNPFWVDILGWILMAFLVIAIAYTCFDTGLAQAQVPRGFYEYGEMCWDTYQEVLGPHATSMDLAQVETESGWRADVCSAYACGLAQFTPATWGDMERLLGVRGSVMDPEMSCLLQAHYNRILARRIPPKIKGWLAQHHWKYRAYNGGERWLSREWIACGSPDNTVAIEPCRLRARWAHKENTEYPWKITKRWTKYLRLGYPS